MPAGVHLPKSEPESGQHLCCDSCSIRVPNFGADGSNHGDQFAIACAEIQIAQRNSPAGEAELAVEDDRPPAASAALVRAPVARREVLLPLRQEILEPLAGDNRLGGGPEKALTVMRFALAEAIAQVREMAQVALTGMLLR